MLLGLKRNEVKLVPHDTTWSNEFQKVKDCLLKETTLKEHHIEHIGSTAIKEIQAKPIIDSLVGVESIEGDLDQLENQLRHCGFYRLRVERPDEIVFAKFTDETFEVKTHYIHLTDFQGDLWNDLIYFRTYLNENQAARVEYEQIKLSFVKMKREGIEEYTNMKEAFVKRILCNRERVKYNKGINGEVQ